MPIAVLGPTASGKTRLAVALAAQLNGEILSIDSRQVYTKMTIGTGKDLEEYGEIPFHLIDIIPAGESYHLHRFQQDFKTAYQSIQTRHKRPILCGGSGLYLEAVLNDYAYTGIPKEPALRLELENHSLEELQQQFSQLHSSYHSIADVSTRKRTIRAIEIARYLQQHPIEIPVSERIAPVLIGLDPPIEIRRERITTRLRQRLQAGLIEEVEGLLAEGIPAEQLVFYGLEYKFITEYLEGKWTAELMFDRLNVAIHQFAKRQMTYFRKMEKDGFIIHWIRALTLEEQLREALEIIHANESV